MREQPAVVVEPGQGRIFKGPTQCVVQRERWLAGKGTGVLLLASWARGLTASGTGLASVVSSSCTTRQHTRHAIRPRTPEGGMGDPGLPAVGIKLKRVYFYS